MLQTIHKYRKSVLGLLAIAAVALAMSGFGVNFMNQSTGNYAIKIDDMEISYKELAEEKGRIIEQYRNIFGGNLGNIINSLSEQISQQAIDSLIERNLLLKFAEENNLVVGDEEVASFIVNTVFQGNFSQDLYKSFLSSQGMSPREFEVSIRKTLLLDKIVSLVDVSAFAGEKELESSLKDSLRKYDISYLVTSSEKFLPSVSEPDEKEITSYYEDNASDFERPAMVEYRYAVLEGKDYLSLVPLQPEDIEFEYTQNQARYTIPESRKVARIQILSTDENREEKRKEAEEILTELSKGKDFGELAKSHSSDTLSSIKGGDIGFITSRSDLHEKLRKEVFSMGAGQVSDVIELPYGFEIVKVNEIQEEKVKEFNEVKEQIERDLRTKDSTTFLLAKVEEILSEDKGETKTLEDVIRKVGDFSPQINTQPMTHLDPPALAGVTNGVMASEGTIGSVDLGNRIVLFERVNSREADIKPIEEVKGEIISAIKNKKANDLLREKIEEAKGKLSNGLEEVQSLLKAERKEVKKVSKAPGGEPVVNAEVSKAISKVASPGMVGEIFSQENRHYVLKIDSIIEPSEDELKKGKEGEKTRLESEYRNLLLSGLINYLKTRYEVDVSTAAFGI